MDTIGAAIRQPLLLRSKKLFTEQKQTEVLARMVAIILADSGQSLDNDGTQQDDIQSQDKPVVPA